MGELRHCRSTLFAGSYLVFLLDELGQQVGYWIWYLSVHRSRCGTIDLRRYALTACGNYRRTIFTPKPSIRDASDDLLHVPGSDEC